MHSHARTTQAILIYGLFMIKQQLKELWKEGRQILLVSSGAVGLGRQRLGLAKDVVANPANVIDRQACAACGQGLREFTEALVFLHLFAS